MIARIPVKLLEKCPAVVHISITKKCNLNCKQCYYRGEENPALIRRIIQNIASSNVKAVAIGGGEPLLHPKIEHFINFLVESGKIVSVTTNGTICKPIDGVSKYAISFDPVHGETWGNPEKVVTTAKIYGEIADVWLNHILTSLNNLGKALNLFCDYISTVTLLALKPIRSIEKKLWFEAIDLVKRYGLRVAIDACVAELLKIGKCRQGLASMSIEADGTCAICSNQRENRISYQGLEKSWKMIKRVCPFGFF